MKYIFVNFIVVSNIITKITTYITDLSYNQLNLANRSNIQGISGPITIFISIPQHK